MNELQLAKIEDVFGVQLPKEFKDYITEKPEALAIFELTWSSDPSLIREATWKAYEDSLRFDIEENNYWPVVFGERPSLLVERVAVAMEYIKTLPPLLPIHGLRKLIPTKTSDTTKEMPILSFHGFSDTIYMYANLDDFLRDKSVSDKKRQQLPRVIGWEKVFDGLGAGDDELYREQ